MKKNNKGFTMLETLVASTLIISTLIFLFVQFNNLKNSYEISFRTNNVQGIYNSKQIKKYLEENNITCQLSSDNICQYSLNNDFKRLFNIDSIYKISSFFDIKNNNDIKTVCKTLCQNYLKQEQNKLTEGQSLNFIIYSNGSYVSYIIE